MARWPLPVALVLTLASAPAVPAQWIPRVEVYSAYTDNVFSTYQKQSDWMTFSYVDLDLAFTDATDLFYAGSASVFGDNEDLFSHTHRLGLTHYLRWDEQVQVTASVDAAVRLDRPTYDFRDFLQGHGVVNLRYQPGTAWVLRGSYETRVQEYTNAEDYSFWENQMQTKWSRSLRWGTTVQLRAEMAAKTYLRATSTDGPADLVFGASERDRHQVQGVAGVRVGQSLGDRAGLQLDYSQRRALAGTGRFDSGFLDTDDDLFDDRFSYEGPELGARVTLLGEWGSQVALGATRERRDYVDRAAYDLLGLSLGETRSDTRWQLSLGARKTFWLDRSWPTEIVVDLNLSRRDVDSNDPYYDATSHVFTTGVQLGF